MPGSSPTPDSVSNPSAPAKGLLRTGKTLAVAALWARTWAVAEAFGLDPELLNDDRIGRALDTVAPHLDHLVGSIGLRAIEKFCVDVCRMHWDMTSISLHGDYEQAEQGYPAPKFGHPKDRRPDLKQIQAGRRLLMIGDSKLISYVNLAALDSEGAGFIAPASKTYVGVEVLRGLELDAAVPVDYVAARDTGKTPDR